MSIRITLLVTALTFAYGVVIAAADEEKAGNEKTWSIGLGKKGVEIEEVESTSKEAGDQSAVGAGRTKWMGGQKYRPLDQDPRWHVGEPIRSGLDVDLTYARIKKAFDFDTTEERLANTPAVRGHVSALHRAGFLYEAEPGAYYKMRDRTLRTADRIVQIEIVRERIGSRIEYGFAKSGLRDVGAYAQQLQTRIVAAVSR